MTPKQAAFVQEYLIDLNATQAAIRAGYSEDTARFIGSENLTKPYIASAIDDAMNARAERTLVTADRVVVELARLGFSNMLDFMDVPEDGEASVNLRKMTRSQAAALTEVSFEESTVGKDEFRSPPGAFGSRSPTSARRWLSWASISGSRSTSSTRAI